MPTQHRDPGLHVQLLVFRPNDYDVQVLRHLESRCQYHDGLVSRLNERVWGPTSVLRAKPLEFLSPNLCALGSDPKDSDGLESLVLHLPVLKA